MVIIMKGNLIPKICLRCLLGALGGLAASNIITIVISMFVGDGNYYAVVPELITDCGNEMNAVLIQAVCSLVYGAAWAGASLIWEAERWSLTRMTVTHLLLCSAATFPIAYFLRWMRHTPLGIFSYFAIFFGIYLMIWLFQYFAIKKQIRQLNEGLRD